jgi:hypothetical protein
VGISGLWFGELLLLKVETLLLVRLRASKLALRRRTFPGIGAFVVSLKGDDVVDESITPGYEISDVI